MPKKDEENGQDLGQLTIRMSPELKSQLESVVASYDRGDGSKVSLNSVACAAIAAFIERETQRTAPARSKLGNGRKGKR